ncbi:ABC transporter related [Alkaliphilus metalliredigens QYMF]|uniref:ABC transporter related n=1 Tax=Alkaliphilus metalliredigens (strain QYMF) TaxID=293826 RepID=A6TLG7_ALKMQ|nr:ABC-F family ATP-binding cassette domain-containing protein [Alkaliphilus metalliredigens]ABR47035.1 ABC transporter related [Alkaliphilus metalliredigens QYMF]
MIILSCNNITKSFGIDVILKDISFSINTGDKIGLVGINGAGKSTLFKILTGQLAYDDGNLYLGKSKVIGHLEQSDQLDEQNTILAEGLSVFTYLIDMENHLRSLELEIASLGDDPSQSTLLEKTMSQYATLLDDFNRENGYGFRSTVRGVLRGLGFTEDEFEQPIYQLSGGQKTRAALAKLLLSKPDILLLDEPTNHLDIGAVEWLEGFLRDYDGTLLMISHDRYFLDQLVNRVFEIEHQGLKTYTGNYSTFTKKKAQEQEQQHRVYQAHLEEVSRQKDIVRRFRQHGTEKLAKRAHSREKQLEKIEEVEKPQAFQKRAKMRFETQIKSGNDVLTVENLCKSFDEHLLFENLTFDLYRGEKVALIGPNGVGKTTLFKILTEETVPSAGDFKLGHQVHIGYYDQEQRNLHLDKIVIDEIWDEHKKLDQTEVRTLLGSFLFHGDDVFKPVDTLSGGERSRISLLKLILSKSNFLLLDEPTNHLDIDSKEVLEESLVDYDGTVFAISHDRYFLNRVATKVIELSTNGIEVFHGNYDYYIEKKKEQLLMAEPATYQEQTKTHLKDVRRKERDERNRLKQETQQREKIETDILELEERLNALESLMCQEDIYTDPQKSREVHQETLTTKQSLEKLYEEWENSVDN